MATNTSTSVKPKFTAEDVKNKTLGWAKGNYIYFIAFFIPVILMLIAYAKFEIYPFGENGSVLALDLNGQYISYFEGLRNAFWGDGSIFYNWGRNLSGEFMGIIGYYLASPFTLIVMLLPRTMILESIMIMQLCKIGAASVTFCYYIQKSKKVLPLQSLMFSVAYSMMAYAVIQTIDPMWLDGIVFLPLVALGIEYFIDDGKKVNYIIPLAIMFVANFYIGFMIAIFTALYYFYYLLFGTENKIDGYALLKKTLHFGICTAVVLMCSAIMILPIYNALALGKFEFSGKPDYSYKAQFSPIELVPTLFPNQYYSVNMHGKPEIYCGMITVVLLPLFYANSKIKWNQKIGYSFLLVVMFLSMYIKPLDMMWHGGQTPNWLPYRYSFIVSFILVSMAAHAFANLDGYKVTLKTISFIFLGILAFVMYFKGLMKTFNYVKKGDIVYVDIKKTFVFGMILVALYLFGLYFYNNAKGQKKNNFKRTLTIAMLVVISAEAGINAYDSFVKIDEEVAYSSRDRYYDAVSAGRGVSQALEDYDNGFYRSEKTYFRSVNDNVSYGLKGISHSSSVMNTKIINFIETMGYSMRSYVTRFDGSTPVADSLLGIKYVIDDNSNSHILNPGYEHRFDYTAPQSSGDDKLLSVYENPDALSIGYMVDEDITKLSHLGNDNPFNSQNMFFSTITGNTQFSTGVDENGNTKTIIDGNKNYYTRLDTEILTEQIVVSNYGKDQTLYTAEATASDPIINVHFTAESTDQIYMYLKTRNEKGVNLWLSSEKDENGRFINHKSFGSGSYYENHNYSIVNVGSFEPGTEIEVRLTVRLNKEVPDTEEYTIIKEFFFYHLNMDTVKEDISLLKQNQWELNIDKTTDTYLEGSVTANEGQLLLTTIPYEEGWTIKVDGKKVEPVMILKSFIGIELEPGTHTVTMRYTPPGFMVGVVTLILGIIIIFFFWKDDRKIVKAMIAKKEAEALALERKANKKAKKIIKSKGTDTVTESDIDDKSKN